MSWKELGIQKINSWELVGQLAIELSKSHDPIESLHGDLWIDQAMSTYTLEQHTL